jgi:hypothetical protein
MESNTELSAIFKELSLENQANLLRRAQLSRASENAVRKKGEDGQKASGFESEYLVAQIQGVNKQERYS